MIQADLAVTGISELATPMGRTALTGTQTGRLHIIADAAVACHGESIVFVGTESEFRHRVEVVPGGVQLDAAGGTVLPGFVDAHTHLPFAGWRETEFDERLRGASYSDIAARGGGIFGGPFDGAGAVWILFLNDDGTVASHQQISSTEGDFTGELDDLDRFGSSLTWLGDLDGDGDSVGALAVTEMACLEEGLMELETRYLNLLGTTKYYAIDGIALALFDSDEDIVLIYEDARFVE